MKDVQNIDLVKIIKRLELIKSLISLEEEDEITTHIPKLEQLDLSAELEKILIYLKEKSYGKAVTAIEVFINSHHQVTFYIDPKIEALRFEAKTFEAQIQQLSNEKAELEKLIHEFGVRHNQELGELIIKILQYRKEQSKGTPQQKEAEKDFEDFNTNYEATKDEKIASITDEEKKELESSFKKARKLCHPDVVQESQKKEAHKIFIELYAAYERNDLQRVKDILEDLQYGKTFTSKVDTANEKKIFQVELARLRKRMNELNKEISAIKTSKTFEKITNIRDWDEYFGQTKQQLQEQLNQLQNGRK